MTGLDLFLLGPPVIVRGEVEVKVDTRKAVALGAFLALEPRAHSREALAAFFWPEYDQQRAHANLRRTVWSLKRAVGEEWLDLDSSQIRLKHELGLQCDVFAFRTLLDGCFTHAHSEDGVCEASLSALTTAVDLYRDDFMTGFTLRDSDAFEEWRFFQAEGLRFELARALERLIECHAAARQLKTAISYARRRLALDTLHEPAHRQLMLLYDWAGQRSAALRQYEECVALLERELSVAPDPETTQLYQAIKASRAPAIPDAALFSLPMPVLDKPSTHPDLPTAAASLQDIAMPERRSAATSIDLRNRHKMLQNVETFWIQGVLENSLRNTIRLHLDIRQENGVVDHPWDSLLSLPGFSGREAPSVASITGVFDRLNGNLLILGEAGSGKTTTLLELARDLVERARKDEGVAIPVVLSLSTWSRRRGALDKWLIDELVDKYQVRRKLASNWVENDALLLLLDGLDELPLLTRKMCVQAINVYRREHGFVDIVVCCRTGDYRVLEDKLRLNAAVTLTPLRDEQIEAYLGQLGEGGKIVRQLVDGDCHLREMCRLPLMLGVTLSAYRDLSGKEMSQLDKFEARRDHLFTAYLRHSLARRVDRHLYAPDRTRDYLAWLAEHMLTRHMTIFRLSDLRPTWLDNRAQRRSYRLAVALAMGLMDGLLIGLGIGLVVCAFYGWVAAVLTGLVAMMSWAVLAVVAVRLGVGLSISKWTTALAIPATALLASGMGFAPLANLVLVLIVALLGGFTTPDEVFEIEMNTTPRGGILRSLRSALWIGLACATLGGLLMGLLAGPIAGLCVGPLLGLAGASIPANSRATVRNWVLRLVLSRNRYLPARYRPFLDYCTRLVLLRKVGAGYVFVHRYLQEYFACQKDTQTGL